MAAVPSHAMRRVAVGGLVVVLAGLPACGSDARSPVVAAPIASIEITPPAPSVRVGETLALTAITRDARGTVLTGRTVTWTTLAASVVTVNSASGVVTGVAQGQGVVVATAEGVTRQVNVTVMEAGPAAVTVTLASSTVNVGRTTQATGTPRDAQGNPLPNFTVTWSSSAPSVATVDPTTGVVTGVSAGDAIITGSATGFPAVAGQATVNVQGAFAIAVASDPSNPSYSPGGTNTSGGTILASRTGVGLYTVTFNGIGTNGGVGSRFTVLVGGRSANPNVSLAAPTAVCNGTFANVQQPLRINVRCEDPVSGAPKDAPFRVLVVGDNSLGATGQPFAYSLHDNLTGGTYPPKFFFSFNPGGGPILIVPGANGGAFGGFQISHQQGVTFGNRTAVMTSAFDGTSGLACTVQSTTPTASDVVCFSRNGPVNAVHALLSTSGGRPGLPAGHAFVGGTGAFQETFSFSTGTSMTVSRTDVGRYTVVFVGMNGSGRETGLLVSPWGMGAWAHCNHFLISNNPMTVDVACFNSSGAFADTQFGLLVLQ